MVKLWFWIVRFLGSLVCSKDFFKGWWGLNIFNCMFFLFVEVDEVGYVMVCWGVISVVWFMVGLKMIIGESVGINIVLYWFVVIWF